MCYERYISVMVMIGITQVLYVKTPTYQEAFVKLQFNLGGLRAAMNTFRRDGQKFEERFRLFGSG